MAGMLESTHTCLHIKGSRITELLEDDPHSGWSATLQVKNNVRTGAEAVIFIAWQKQLQTMVEFLSVLSYSVRGSGRHIASAN
jgi:hypothetical protein